MLYTLLKSKLHRATVTGASLDYENSLTISSDLAELARMTPEEAVRHRPRIVVLDEKNRIVRYEGNESAPSLRVVGD